MPKPPIDEKSVKISDFAKKELKEFVEKVSTTEGGVQVGERDLLGALVLAGRRFPIEFVRASVLAYWDRAAREISDSANSTSDTATSSDEED